MKKILSAVAAFALAAALISCGGNSDEFDGKVDTVLTIGAPSVTAKAYPGVNYVTWSVVPSATSYELYRQADGVDGSQKIAAVTGTNTAYADVASTSNVLADGKTYKYTVVAVPGNSTTANVNTPSRDVYMKANSGSASVKAYVPAAGTVITAFTDSYTKDFLKKYADAKSLEKAGAKITFVNDVIGGGDLYATYPATAGFSFGVKFINKTQPEYIQAAKTATGTAVYLENYTGNYKTTATLGGGEYDAYVTVSSVSGLYPTTVVYSLGTYTIPELKVVSGKGTGTPSAEWSADGKKVVLSWTPAVLAATNDLAPIANYKVYRKVGTATLTDGETLTPVTATIKVVNKYNPSGDSDNIDTVVANNAVSTGTVNEIAKVYTLEDEVANGDYSYYVVNTDGTEFEAFGTTTKKVAYISGTRATYYKNTTAAPEFVVARAISKDRDNQSNQIKIQAAKGKRDGNFVVTQKLALSYVKLDDKVTTDDTYNKVLASDFTTVDITKNNDVTEESYISYDLTKASIGTYLFKLTATEDGYDPQSTYKIVYVTVAGTPIVTSDIHVVRVGPATTSAPIENTKLLVWDANETADSLPLYKYNIVSVKETKNNAPYGQYVEVTSTVKELKLEIEQVKDADWRDADKKYVKSGVAANAANGDNGKTGDDLRHITHPYALVDDVKSDKNADGKTTTITWSVQKVLASDANVYKFSDDTTRADSQVTVSFHN